MSVRLSEKECRKFAKWLRGSAEDDQWVLDRLRELSGSAELEVKRQTRLWNIEKLQAKVFGAEQLAEHLDGLAEGIAKAAPGVPVKKEGSLTGTEFYKKIERAEQEYAAEQARRSKCVYRRPIPLDGELYCSEQAVHTLTQVEGEDGGKDYCPPHAIIAMTEALEGGTWKLEARGAWQAE